MIKCAKSARFFPLKFFFFLSILPAIPNAWADEVNFRDFDNYQRTLDRAQVQSRLNKFLQKSPKILDHLRLSDDALLLYASLADKEHNHPEYILNFGDQAKPVSLEKAEPFFDQDRPLAGLRVALDPGHIGGEFARLEGRYIDMKPKEGGFQFDEGTLTVATAKYLKRLLENAGAVVMLTRTEPGQFISAVGYPEWRRSKAFVQSVEEKVAAIADPKKREAARSRWLKEASDPMIFRQLYISEDLRARAKKINDFKPDVTFDIHYNAAASNDNKTGQNLGSSENYNMVFVPGSFMARENYDELSDQPSRYEFIRLLVTADLERSIKLSAELIKQFEKRLKVGTVKKDEKTAPYLASACLPAGPNGVYCRNLGITRLVRGAIAYGESLCQDNFEECQRLAETSFEIEGIKTSPRIKLVAEAYYLATLAVYGNSKE